MTFSAIGCFSTTSDLMFEPSCLRNWNYSLELKKIKSVLVTVIARNIMFIDLNIETVYSVVFMSVKAQETSKSRKTVDE